MIQTAEKRSFEDPSIVVGISAYNEEKNIPRLLRRIANEQLGKYRLKRIVVVSSGSTDRTNELVEDFCNKNSSVQLVTEPRRYGKYTAVNKILNAGREGDITILVSADTLPSEWALHYTSIYFKKIEGLGGLCSKIIPINQGNGLADKVSKAIWDLHDVFLTVQSKLGKVTHLGGEFTAIRSNTVERIPPIIQDELYLGMELAQMGYGIVYAPELIVNIKAPSNIHDFVRQRLRAHVGHRELAKMYSYGGTNINKIISDPQFAFSLVKPIIIRYRTNLHILLAFVILEASLWFRARFKHFKEYTAWKMVSTTKELKSGNKDNDEKYLRK